MAGAAALPRHVENSIDARRSHIASQAHSHPRAHDPRATAGDEAKTPAAKVLLESAAGGSLPPVECYSSVRKGRPAAPDHSSLHSRARARVAIQ